MENKVGKIWTPEQRGQPFISCWPHHHEFWLPELSPGGPKEHMWQVWAAAFWSSWFFFLTVHCDVLHARHQLITSAWSLYSNHWLRYFFNPGHGGAPDLHKGRSHLKESCEVGAYFKGQLHAILTNVLFPPPVQPCPRWVKHRPPAIQTIPSLYNFFPPETLDLGCISTSDLDWKSTRSHAVYLGDTLSH